MQDACFYPWRVISSPHSRCGRSRPLPLPVECDTMHVRVETKLPHWPLRDSLNDPRLRTPFSTFILCFRYLLHVLRSKAKILHFPSTPRSLDRMSFPPPLAGPFNSPGPSPGGSFRFPTNFPSSSQPANVFSSVELAGIGQPYSNLPRPQRLEFVHQSNYQMYTTPNSIAQIPWSSPAHLTRPEESVEEETSDTTVTEFDEHVDEQMDSSQTDERARVHHRSPPSSHQATPRRRSSQAVRPQNRGLFPARSENSNLDVVFLRASSRYYRGRQR